MSFLGTRTISPGPGGFDGWSFAHARHHDAVTGSLNQTRSFTGNTTVGSNIITNLSSVTGLYRGMLISGGSIPSGAEILAVDNLLNRLSITANVGATAATVSLSARFEPLPYFILDPVDINKSDQFLLDHQLSHNAINGALGTTGNDLQDVNWENEQEIRAWLDLDFAEHQTWMQITAVT